MDKWMVDSIVAGIIEDEERTASSNLRNNNIDDDDDTYCEHSHKSSIDYSVGIKFMRH